MEKTDGICQNLRLFLEYDAKSVGCDVGDLEYSAKESIISVNIEGECEQGIIGYYLPYTEYGN